MHRAFQKLQNRMTPKSELGSETARRVKKSMDRQTFSAVYRSDAIRNSNDFRDEDSVTPQPSGGSRRRHRIGALMGEIPVETLPLELDLDLKTVRPYGPLPLPAMKCIGHFRSCKIE